MENEELEALEEIKELCTGKYGIISERDIIVLNLIDKVKNALTRLEKLEKAIKIVKTKLVDFNELNYAINCDESALYFCGKKLSRCEKYNLSKTDDYALTEEEFNLLKEVFGNEN